MSDDREIIMYSITWCGFCHRARLLLQCKGMTVREIRIDEDPAARERMLEKSGGRRTLPQIFIGEHHVGGFEELVALDRSGELDKLLAAPAWRRSQPW
jgi:glutaredoxin 3